ncbi:MAG: DUF1127 domain-containing protein [Alphaproteobacteria bacterium]|jgi:uncharacterized protein YjiS (DUF1127 family)|nr:DUF1127 domain-containing protein [Alphaproteobacteria bacterium]
MYRTLPTTVKTIDLSTLSIRLVDTLLAWQDRAQQRYRLAEMDDRMLKDIGVGHASARAEAAKPFWRA